MPCKGEQQCASSDSESTKTPCMVMVQWDCGNRCRYRCGIKDKYDLRVIESAPAGGLFLLFCGDVLISNFKI